MVQYVRIYGGVYLPLGVLARSFPLRFFPAQCTKSDKSNLTNGIARGKASEKGKKRRRKPRDRHAESKGERYRAAVVKIYNLENMAAVAATATALPIFVRRSDRVYKAANRRTRPWEAEGGEKGRRRRRR